MSNKTYKIVVDGITRSIRDYADQEAIQIIFDKYQGDAFSLKTIEEILNENILFSVRSYQRGYRWGKEEVSALFDDIKEFSENSKEDERYCLQPLVVRKIVPESNKSEKGEETYRKYNCCYEVIDGQQRLTTLRLLLLTIDENLCPYGLEYEIKRKIDKDFRSDAEILLKGKLKELNEKEIVNFRDALIRKTAFLWYEISDSRVASDQSSEKIFRQLNKGKIELTNAELFKALLLDGEKAKTLDEKREQEQIAFEWDKIEKSLRNDEFWFFISNDISEDRTRIDYILDIYANSLEEGEEFDSDKDRYSFLVVQEHLKKHSDNSFSDIRKIWEDIVFVHDKLYSWFLNDCLYHCLGFLVATEGKYRRAFSEMVSDVYAENKDKEIEETKKYVKKKISCLFFNKENKRENYNKWVDNLSYDDRPEAFKFLLFCNIHPYLKGENGRFPFKKFYKESWDLEHINPQTANKDISCQNASLVWDYLENTYPEEFEGINKPKTDQEIADRLSKFDDNLRQTFFLDGSDDISNLVLLNSSINRKYHNSLFMEKRAEIIDSDKNGKFIPLSTKSVFMKYYSNNPTQFVVWDDKDQESYLDYLKTIAEEISNW